MARLGPRGDCGAERALLAPPAGAEVVVVEVEDNGDAGQLVHQEQVLDAGGGGRVEAAAHALAAGGGQRALLVYASGSTSPKTHTRTHTHTHTHIHTHTPVQGCAVVVLDGQARLAVGGQARVHHLRPRAGTLVI